MTAALLPGNVALEYAKNKLCIGGWHGRMIPNMIGRTYLWNLVNNPAVVVADGGRRATLSKFARYSLLCYCIYVTQPKLVDVFRSKDAQATEAFLQHKKSKIIPAQLRNVNRHIYTAVTLAAIFGEFARACGSVAYGLVPDQFKFDRHQDWQKEKGCPVCLSKDPEKGPPMSACPNGHRFHKSCLEEWFNNNANAPCPTCRAPARELQGIARAAAMLWSAHSASWLLRGAGYLGFSLAALYSIAHNRKAGNALQQLAAQH